MCSDRNPPKDASRRNIKLSLVASDLALFGKEPSCHEVDKAIMHRLIRLGIKGQLASVLEVPWAIAAHIITLSLLLRK